MGYSYLQVRYDLLDCHHSFYESVKKLIGVMETGMVKGGEALVPHLFQFLVLLASDQSKILTIPQVSRCFEWCLGNSGDLYCRSYRCVTVSWLLVTT